MAGEVVKAIGLEVPGYGRPFEGAFGRAVQTGVSEALRRFITLVGDPEATSDQGRERYVALGRGEYRSGRTLDALQAAYRVGARVAWRHFARAAHTAGLGHEEVARLAEAMFAYIDELSAESIEGYAQAQSELAGERQRLRRELVTALLQPRPGADLPSAAAGAGWELPRTAAALACPVDGLTSLARRLGSDVLAAPAEGTGCIIVPDAEGPGRREALRGAASQRQAAIGPDGPLSFLPQSWQLARGTLTTAVTGLAVADDHLAELLVSEAALVVERIAVRRLAALSALTPAARTRMEQTALAYIQSQGNAAAMSRALCVHPQTARYRLARLRELLGTQLAEPAARFEIEAALRGATARVVQPSPGEQHRPSVQT
ncbi:MAG: PucR family transcriptional regulator [Solirubrobacteraceae bacterium]